jgi:hypothetical protein
VVVRFAKIAQAVTQQQRAFSILTQQEVGRIRTEGCTVGWGSYISAGDKLTELQSELDAAKLRNIDLVGLPLKLTSASRAP